MKRIVILLIFIFTIQSSFGQACGIYRIKYVGNIKSDSIKIKKIKLPTIKFLHGLDEEFIENKPSANEFDIEIRSHLTSHLYTNAESLLNLYKVKRKTLPILITVIENGKNREIQLELSWNNVKIKKIEDQNFGNLFELNLNDINI